MNLSNVDLNLFLVLHTVLVEGSATRAAEKLHVTQSAVSNALARLRSILDDPLVVRSGAGLVPTPKAARLAPLLAEAIEKLRSAVDAEAFFDPKSTTRAFTIACSDYEEVVLLPALMERLASEMPRAELRAVTIDHLLASNGLETGEIDALVGMPPSIPSGCVAEQIFEDEVVCVVRRQHPHAAPTMTLGELVSHPHVHTAVVATSRRLVDQALAAEKMSRRIALTVPHFSVAAMTVARTDFVLPFPHRMAVALAGPLDLRVVRVPELERLPRSVTSLIWHARTDPDPACRALREIVRSAALTLPALGRAATTAKPPRSSKTVRPRRAHKPERATAKQRRA